MSDYLVIDIDIWREGRWVHREEVEAWFAKQGWTNGEDFVLFGRARNRINHVGWLFADPAKAVMFKLAWG